MNFQLSSSPAYRSRSPWGSLSLALLAMGSLAASTAKAQDADDQNFAAPRKIVRPSRAAPPDPGDPDLIVPEAPRKPLSKAKPAPAPTRAAAPDSAMDFDLLPERKGAELEMADVSSKVNTRRTMLQLHQGFGIATAVLMAGTVVFGQLNYSDRFGGGRSTGQFELLHSGLEAATVISFATSGLLAVFAPVPFEKKSSGVDSLTIHKWSMIAATAGMVAEIPLGIYTVAREGYVDQATFAVIHLAIGYFTAAALGTGATALFF